MKFKGDRRSNIVNVYSKETLTRNLNCHMKIINSQIILASLLHGPVPVREIELEKAERR